MGKYRYNLATSNPSGNSREYTSNLYKKMGAFYALISVRYGLESISKVSIINIKKAICQ